MLAGLRVPLFATVNAVAGSRPVICQARQATAGHALCAGTAISMHYAGCGVRLADYCPLWAHVRDGCAACAVSAGYARSSCIMHRMQERMHHEELQAPL